jgi:hypothetical protein
MANNTLFAYIKGVISDANNTVPEASTAFIYPPFSAVHNVPIFRRETLSLDDGDTRSVTIPAYSSSQWVGFMARVVGTDGAPGEAKLTTVGLDWDGSTAIEGVTGGYGTNRHPGFISMVTKNVTTFTLEGIADGTEIEYLVMILAEDDQI